MRAARAEAANGRAERLKERVSQANARSAHAAVFTAPPGALVTLRTSAADAAGGTVMETITSAYRTGR
jgi:hypothetical protein